MAQKEKIRDRRVTPKGVMEKVSGRKIDSNLLPALHKVQILEYLLTCPASELDKYQTPDTPNFIYEAAKLLLDSRLPDFIAILNDCRTMAREDAINAK